MPGEVGNPPCFNDNYALMRHFKPNRTSRVLSFGCAKGVDPEKYYWKHGFELHWIEIPDSLIAEFIRRFPLATISKAHVNGAIDYLV